ncbi:MAG: RNA methyltransferase, partial [Bacteroidota bacterium]|nr:RNA methyltransferase [Candidatus Kapabacteria bacterium]MDW8221212.1 RNA methyltransferase [Bacteroidota bacterium]
LFVVENSKVIRRLLNSACQIHSFFATPEYYEEFSELLQAKGVESDKWFVAEKKLMNEIVGFRLHEGVMALACVPSMPYVLDDIESLVFPLVLLVGISNAENVGAIVRNCAAFGIPSLAVDAATCNPYIRRAVRVSLGGIFALRVYRAERAADTLVKLKRTCPDIQIVALEACPHAQSICRLNFQARSIIVFGSEAHGLPEEVLSVSDALVQIQMQPNREYNAVNSLNVASASAIALYQYSRCVFL